ncbi:hypothetical protein HUJ04_003809 [Dendroctonus ponderosae]|nr:hypothetical protein HUJ04_003809 [Dendroctonus ponderosae]
MYATSRAKPFYWALMLLNLLLWYPMRNGKSYMKIFISLSILLRTISLLSFSGTLAHLILVKKNGTNIDISEDIGDIFGFVGCMSVSINFSIYHGSWSRFFNNLLNFGQFGEPPGYKKIVKRGNMISLVCIIYTFPGMLWYCLLSYMQVPHCKEMNVKMGLNEPCGMINPTWLPVKEMEKSHFKLVYIFQAVGIFVYLPSTLVISSIPLEAVEIIVARLNHLKGLFRDAFKSEDPKICSKQLSYCIRYHQDIIKVSQELSGLVKPTMGSLFLTAAIVIGSLGSQILKASTPKAISFIMGYILTVFIGCHAGQRLIDESLDLAKYVYDTRWYEMEPKVRKDIVFILKRCQKPITLGAPPSMGSAGYLLFFIVS